MKSDVSKSKFRGKSENLSEFCVVENVFHRISTFCKKYIKIDTFLHFAPNPIKTRLRWSHFGPKSSKVHFLLQNHFLGPKVHFGPKMHFWRKKWFLGQKCDLEQKVPLGTLTNSHTPSPNRLRARPDPKKWIFAPKSTFLLQNAFWAQKRTFGAQVPFLRKMHFCVPMPRMLIKPMEF
jgi:hypothetical protein